MDTIITLENINKRYQKQIVFNDYNLEVKKGEFLSIRGVSGSGKSTLLNIIGLLDYPDSGTVKIHGVTNPKLEKRSGRNLVRKNIAYLFQNFALVEQLSARKNLELQSKLSKQNLEDSKLQSLLNEFGVLEFIDKKVFQLSGGEQQRLALVRALMKHPTIVLADEPTASLDQENAEIVMNTLKKMHKDGATIVVVTHNPEIAKYADRIIEIEKINE